QTFVIAALAMTTMLGALSMVVDAGIYFVIQRQLQNAADAAALAAVWYDPACSSTHWSGAGCQPSNPNSPAPECPPTANLPAGYDPKPCTAAAEAMKANWSVALSLCAGPNLPAGTPGVGVTIDTYAGLANFSGNTVPGVQPYVVTLSCKAPHWFGRVLPGVNLTMSISASAAAALGWLAPNGQLHGDPQVSNEPLVARLLP
ncbi:MAG: hypothetical protein JO020_12670, partial [Chloroflexi bacterium]|nr:hypothetical protein [Chloroflexota bacterium]